MKGTATTTTCHMVPSSKQYTIKAAIFNGKTYTMYRIVRESYYTSQSQIIFGLHLHMKGTEFVHRSVKEFETST